MALAALSGCAALSSALPQDFSRGTTLHTLSVGGFERSYRLYIPDGLAAGAPLVVMLHGGFGSGEQAQRSYGWDAVADGEKLVTAYPDGVGRAWNAGDCCGRPARDAVDDIGFIGTMVADIAAGVSIDPARVYATGMSNGAMMTYALACRTDLFAAIGPVAGTQVEPCSVPRPTSVLAIHGTGDRAVRYDGERGVGVAEVDGPPVAEVNAFWRNVNGCAEPAVDVDGAVTTSVARCPGGRGVTLITVDGAGHQWPGSRPIRAGADPPSDALDATTVLSAFFAAHERVG